MPVGQFRATKSLMYQISQISSRLSDWKGRKAYSIRYQPGRSLPEHLALKTPENKIPCICIVLSCKEIHLWICTILNTFNGSFLIKAPLKWRSLKSAETIRLNVFSLANEPCEQSGLVYYVVVRPHSVIKIQFHIRSSQVCVLNLR